MKYMHKQAFYQHFSDTTQASQQAAELYLSQGKELSLYCSDRYKQVIVKEMTMDTSKLSTFNIPKQSLKHLA